MTNLTKPFLVLIADDDSDDRLLAKEAFDESNLNVEVVFHSSGDELLAWLYKTIKEDGHIDPLCSLILLDWNMPGKNGAQVLEELKTHPLLRKIPVVILSTSLSPHDISTTYNLGGNSFITKPNSFENLLATIQNLGSYWFKTVKLPV